MSTTRYVLLTLGENPVWYRQAAYAILTLLVQAPEPKEVLVVTDHPERYGWFGERVRCHVPTAETVRDWKGRHGFFWRVDLQVMALACTLEPVPQRIVYVDGDTACHRDLGDLLTRIDAGEIFLHQHEYDLATAKRSGERRQRRAVWGREFAGCRVGPGAAMWNNGVTALSVRHSGVFARATAILDAMQDAEIESFYLAQLALSLAVIEVTKPQEAKPWFHHYWANKDGWNQAIAAFLADAQLHQWTVDQAIDQLRRSPIDRPVWAKLRGWQRWLVRMAKLPAT